LREFADRVERCAQKPVLRGILEAGILRANAPELPACARGFENVDLMATDGRLIAQAPSPKAFVVGNNYEFRQYFRGARSLAERGLPGAYLGPAYRAESDGQMEFSFAAPVLSNDGKWLGNLVASLNVDSTIGQVRMTDPAEGGRIVALIGPRDNDRFNANAPLPSDFYFIVHPELARGREVPLRDPSRVMLERAFGRAAPAGEQFSLRWAPPLLLPDYHDPLLTPARSSLAALAPVGRTGYIVIVQLSKDAAQRDGRALVRKLAWRAGLPLAAGSLLFGFGVLATVRRRRGLETRPG
jgi:hypothetical protein